MAKTIFSNTKILLPNWLLLIYLLKYTGTQMRLEDIMRLIDCTNVTACSMRRKINGMFDRPEPGSEFPLMIIHKKRIIDELTNF